MRIWSEMNTQSKLRVGIRVNPSFCALETLELSKLYFLFVLETAINCVLVRFAACVTKNPVFFKCSEGQSRRKREAACCQ